MPWNYLIFISIWWTIIHEPPSDHWLIYIITGLFGSGLKIFAIVVTFFKMWCSDFVVFLMRKLRIDYFWTFCIFEKNTATKGLWWNGEKKICVCTSKIQFIFLFFFITVFFVIKNRFCCLWYSWWCQYITSKKLQFFTINEKHLS